MLLHYGAERLPSMADSRSGGRRRNLHGILAFHSHHEEKWDDFGGDRFFCSFPDEQKRKIVPAIMSLLMRKIR